MYANGFTMWHYKSVDSVTDVLASSYFDVASDMLRTGDFLFVNLNVNGSGENDLLVVTSNDDGVVNVAAPGFTPEQTVSL